MSAERDQRFMQRALLLAQRAAELGEVPVGAVLVQGDTVIGEGWNQPISARDPSAHAEIIALRDAAQRVGNYRLPATTLYVTIEPCTMCAGAMIHARIGRLVYGAPEPKSGVGHSNGCLFDGAHLNHRPVLQRGVLEQESAALISAFFQRRRASKRRQREPSNNT